MRLTGSCHCRAVRFQVESETPYPFNRCYCTLCRKTVGGGGYAINIMGLSDSLKVEGEENVTVYRAAGDTVDGGAEADGLSWLRRHFCGRCGSALWASDPRWPHWVYPLASAIDSPLPVPPETVHLMLASAPLWALPADDGGDRFDAYPDEGIEDWHRARGLLAP